MYTAEALLDIHERAHRALERMLAHCATLPAGATDRELAGFGYPTIRLQVHHVLGAERYWLGVLHGRMDLDGDADAFPDVAALAALRESVAAATRAYLRGASPDELNAARPMEMWGGRRHDLVPARVILRTQTHVFHHLGQMAAMCRLLGQPSEGTDFPIA